MWRRYGDDASQATDTAIKSVVNVGVTAYNIDNLGIKAILKTTGKQAAKAMVKKPDGKDTKEEPKRQQSLQQQLEENKNGIEGQTKEEKK